jgi:hypothetical protein
MTWLHTRSSPQSSVRKACSSPRTMGFVYSSQSTRVELNKLSPCVIVMEGVWLIAPRQVQLVSMQDGVDGAHGRPKDSTPRIRNSKVLVFVFNQLHSSAGCSIVAGNS